MNNGAKQMLTQPTGVLWAHREQIFGGRKTNLMIVIIKIDIL